MATHLRMRSIQDRFKYLEMNHPQIFMLVGEAILRKPPFDKVKEQDQVQMQNDLQGALVKVVWEPHLKFGLADDFYVDALEVILH